MKLSPSQFPPFPYEKLVQADDVEGLKKALAEGELTLDTILQPEENRFDMFGWSFVHFCAGNSAVRILRYIFDDVVKVNVLKTFLESNSGSDFCREYRNAVSKLVLVKSADKELPLHLACQQATPETIELLLRVGGAYELLEGLETAVEKTSSSPTTSPNHQQKTETIAAVCPSPLARLQCCTLNEEGSSPLHVAVEHSDSRKSEHSLRAVLEALLLRGGASMTQKDASGFDAGKVAVVYTNRGKKVADMIAEIDALKKKTDSLTDGKLQESAVEKRVQELVGKMQLG